MTNLIKCYQSGRAHCGQNKRRKKHCFLFWGFPLPSFQKCVNWKTRKSKQHWGGMCGGRITRNWNLDGSFSWPKIPISTLTSPHIQKNVTHSQIFHSFSLREVRVKNWPWMRFVPSSLVSWQALFTENEYRQGRGLLSVVQQLLPFYGHYCRQSLQHHLNSSVFFQSNTTFRLFRVTRRCQTGVTSPSEAYDVFLHLAKKISGDVCPKDWEPGTDSHFSANKETKSAITKP